MRRFFYSVFPLAILTLSAGWFLNVQSSPDRRGTMAMTASAVSLSFDASTFWTLKLPQPPPKVEALPVERVAFWEVSEQFLHNPLRECYAPRGPPQGVLPASL